MSDSDESSDDMDISSNGLDPGAYWLEEKKMRRIQVLVIQELIFDAIEFITKLSSPFVNQY